MTSGRGTSHSTTMPPTHAAKRQAEAERDKSRPYGCRNPYIYNKVKTAFRQMPRALPKFGNRQNKTNVKSRSSENIKT